MDIKISDVLFLSSEQFQFDGKTYYNARILLDGRVLRLKSNASLYEAYKSVKEVRGDAVLKLGVYSENPTLTLVSFSQE